MSNPPISAPGPIPPLLVDDIKGHRSFAKLIRCDKRANVVDVDEERTVFAILSTDQNGNPTKHYLTVPTAVPDTDTETLRRARQAIANLRTRVETLEKAVALLMTR